MRGGREERDLSAWYRDGVSDALTPTHLRTIRTRLGLTQPELAQHLGIDTATVWSWENRRRTINPLACRALRDLETQYRRSQQQARRRARRKAERDAAEQKERLKLRDDSSIL